jgi:peptide/nickel transport system permease protein
MPFKPVILWTDALIFLLVAVLIAFVWYVRSREHLLQPWRKVAQSRTGMTAAVILLSFVAIGLLDSLHFRPRLHSTGLVQQNFSVETLSVLDVIAKHLRTRTEKTYSAPLATHLFSRETVELPDGSQARVYPRLVHGGAHLDDPQQQWATDVTKRAVGGVGIGVLLWNGLIVLVTAWLAQRRRATFNATWQEIWQGRTAIPWREMLITAGVVLFIVTPMVVLSRKYHVLGTDQVGQDVFYLSLKSIRTGLVIGTLTTLVMLPFALLLGIMAGYLRGWVDDVVQYVYTTLNSIPGVLLIAAAILMTQAYMSTHPDLFDTIQQRQDVRLLFLCLILGVTSWTGLCRLLRGEALKLRETEYIQAAQAFGVPDFRIITRHILPNVMHIVLIAVVMDFSALVLAEAVLSYVGVGVDPTMASFGNMINAARLEMAREPMVWWSLASAFVFMLLLVLAANLFADAVRDAFDPRIGGRASRPDLVAKALPATGMR